MATHAAKQRLRALIAVVAFTAIPAVAQCEEPPQKKLQPQRPDYYAPATEATLLPLEPKQRPTGSTVRFSYFEDETATTRNDTAELPSPSNQAAGAAAKSSGSQVIQSNDADQEPIRKAANTDRSSAAAKPDRLLETLRPLGTISLDTGGRNKTTPKDVYGEHHPDQAIPFEMMRSEYCVTRFDYHWAASNLSHYPLYTEDVALERYGKGYCPLLQPLVSGLRFYHSVATLPYRMGVNLPGENMYVLGYHRPGNWSPSARESLPWSWRGAAFQAGVAAGGVYLFPVP